MIASPSGPWRSRAAWRTYLAGALWILGTAVSWFLGTPDHSGWLQVRLDHAGLMLLAAALIGGWNFFPKGLRAVQRRRLDMNFLMTVAIFGALLIGEPIEAAAIAALFSLAELLEAAAVHRARRSVEELIRIAPERARVVTPDGEEREVPARDLIQGQRIRIRPGEKVAIDGRVIEGESAVDEATVTGESVPVTKRAGDPVYAGTLLVEGYLEIEATTNAGDTTLDRIVRLVREAQASRSASERFVDRFAAYYTPTITVLAVLTMLLPPLLGWGPWIEWFTRGLTLLVVACPCALVIATPVTIVSAITTGARHGVLVKGGQHLETLGRTCAMAFDKTGSLTEGRLRVTAVEGLAGTAPEAVIRLAAAVEQRSEHPIARAIVSYADEHDGSRPSTAVAAFEAIAGRGARAIVDGTEIFAGSPELLGLTDPPERFQALQDEGRTVVLIGRRHSPLGLVALADTPRPGARDALARLRKMGIHEIVLLTGDAEPVARRVAGNLGITDVRARLLPEAKVAAIRELLARHGTVAMLGDGVNDAPALATASVGIAMGAAGSPATIETADVALMADDIRMLPYAVRVARLARQTIRFNIGLALALKFLLAAGAIGGVVSLLVAVLLGDLGASLAVTLNAMRLARLTPERRS